MSHAAATPGRWVLSTPNTNDRLLFGADYNPDQWTRDVWVEDVRLMREAGVNIVSLAIFSWSQLQPAEDRWTFDWLDDIIELLHSNEIAVDLATATASPPPWLTTKYPEILPENARGETLHPGGRQHWRPTSPVFRAHALELVTRLAQRYATHPAVVAWHINNEIGCHNAWDHSADATRSFRKWLRHRYQTIDALNEAWGTSFWSQRYTDFAEIHTPRLAAADPNPTQQLDFKRFSSNALQEHLQAERAVLQHWAPDIPITTNFMVMDSIVAMNYDEWAADVDFISNDHYVTAARPNNRDELSFSANLTSGLAQGLPWFLMEHSTSAVNWQPVNTAKPAGAMASDALTHVAHGADAVCFFQWRQSRAGSEKFHSAMVPHAGEDSAQFRAVVDLGDTLKALAPIAGLPRQRSRIALLFSWESWWASEQDSHHTTRFRYRDECVAWYQAVVDAGHRVDVLPISSKLDGYDYVIAPSLHLMTEDTASSLVSFTTAGGHLLTTFNSGLVDENDHAWLGGYPGPLRDLLGIRVQEIQPLLDGETVEVFGGHATFWSEAVDIIDPTVEIIAAFESGPLDGMPAITRRAAGAGTGAYVAADLDASSRARVMDDLLTTAGIESELPESLRGNVELVVRGTGDVVAHFLINRSGKPIDLREVAGSSFRGGTVDAASNSLPAVGVAVYLSPHSAQLLCPRDTPNPSLAKEQA